MAVFVFSTKNMSATESKVLIMGLLLFVQSIIGGFLVLVTGGDEPSTFECIAVLLTASSILVTFMLTFLRTGQIPNTKETKEDKKE